MGEPVTLEADVKACQKPVKISIILVKSGKTFRMEYDGQKDIPLPGVSFKLTVNANPSNNGDLQLKVKC